MLCFYVMHTNIHQVYLFHYIFKVYIPYFTFLRNIFLLFRNIICYVHINIIFNILYITCYFLRNAISDCNFFLKILKDTLSLAFLHRENCYFYSNFRINSVTLIMVIFMILVAYCSPYYPNKILPLQLHKSSSGSIRRFLVTLS